MRRHVKAPSIAETTREVNAFVQTVVGMSPDHRAKVLRELRFTSGDNRFSRAAREVFASIADEIEAKVAERG